MNKKWISNDRIRLVSHLTTIDLASKPAKLIDKFPSLILKFNFWGISEKRIRIHRRTMEVSF